MKEKSSDVEPEVKDPARKAAKKGTGSARGQVKADKLLAEIEHYRARVAGNEERLRSGKASDGTPLTDLQRANLTEIIARQRERLLELSS